MCHLGAENHLGASDGRLVGALLGRMDESILKERAYEELLGLAVGEAAVLEVGDLLGGDRTDGGTMLTVR